MDKTVDSISRINLGSDYTEEEVIFLRTIDRYKSSNHRPHPTWREMLAIIHSLGYRKVADPSPLPRPQDILRGAD